MPTVVTFHDLRVPYLFPKAGFVREWIVRKLARDADGIIASDRSDEATIQERWHLDRVCWIPIGSNILATLPSNSDREADRLAIGITENQLLISYFGFLNSSKGGLVLLDALSQIVDQGVDAHLIMIGGRAGDSDLTNYGHGEEVDTRIHDLRLARRVHWTGFVSSQEVSRFLFASDITALPYLDGASLRRGTLMAALAHGRAIVTTEPISRIPELDGAIETVSANSAPALATRIIELWSNQLHRLELEKAALNAAASFSWDTVASRTLEFFATTLATAHA